MKRPSFQFYPGDWLNDFNLSMCSLGAQGLWIRLMCFMHQGEPYGYLRVNGRVITPDILHELAGKPTDIVLPLLRELEAWGVIGKTPDGCYYSRRMVDDEERRKEAVLQGSKGGNPKLKPKKTATAGITNGLTDQITDPINSSSSSSSSSEKERQVVVDEAAAKAKEDCLALINRQYPSWVMSGERFKEFLAYEDTMPWTVLLKAVQVTMAAGERKINYLLGVCRNWAEANVKTLEEADSMEAAHRAARNRRTGQPQNRPEVITSPQFQGVDPEEILKR